MHRLFLLLVVCAVFAAGCGGDDSDEPSADREPSNAQPAAATTDEQPAKPRPADRGPLIKLRDSQLGPVLFDGRDRALYLFTRDAKRKTRCYGACATAWPPFYANGKPRAGRGVDASKLGTIARRDGRRQVTYRGQPLYFYVDDPKGQALCNDVAEFGGTWFALTAGGKPPS